MALAACAHGGAVPATPSPDPNPIIRREVVRQLYCPDALSGLLPDAPTPAADAVIRANEAGDAFLDARIGRGDAAVQILADAKAECARWAGTP